jgi:uncharacterized protein (DUF433 family)
MTTVAVGHVVIDDRGRARVEGSRIRVIDLVMARMANGWTPEQLQQQYPHLTLAQVYAALAYYHANKQQLDAEIEQSGRVADEMRANAPESPFAKRLRESGKRP